MIKIADLYIRVSTDEQANSGYSQRHQDEMLRRYCAIQGIQIRKVFFEDHSAKSFDRPEWKKMLAEYKKQKGLINHILFLKWDRFSRNAGDSYAMISTLNKLGIEPQAIEQPLDLSIPENKLMLAFFLAAPEVENSRRALNVIHGMRRAMKEGRVMALAPKGYVNKTNETGRKYIAPKEPEAGIVRWIFEQLASDKWVVMELWKQAMERGLKCSQSYFYAMLNNPVYCGKVFIPAYKNEPAVVVPGTHEPIITEALFYEVQDILHGRKKPRSVRKAIRTEFPLRNFLICPNCGRPITASTSKGQTKRYNYYHCISSCGWRFNAELVHQKFVEELNKYVIRKPIVHLYKEVMQDIVTANYSGSKANKALLVKQINEQNKRLEKARELLLADDIDGSDYKTIKSECERKVEALEAQLATVPNHLENFDVLLDKALYNLTSLDVRYEKAPIEEKREIISSIYPEKLVFDGFAYRTEKVNEAVSLVYAIGKAFEENKIEKTEQKLDLSCVVVPTRIELVSKV